MSSSCFEVPPYQREYSWLEDDVSEFWNDLKNGLGDEPYFLGLIILTDGNGKKQVVDGQQRILTLTLLAAALFHEAVYSERKALAERIQADFLRTIDYDTDETHPRVTLSDSIDNEMLQSILNDSNYDLAGSLFEDKDSLSQRMSDAFKYLREQLREDLNADSFKRLGIWTDFITNRLYFVVFVHPDTASAYRVFEIINTRGRELTTADLLKNYVLSQTPADDRDRRYRQWQEIARQFSPIGSNSLVQYIRHVVTVEGGHILPKDLFDFLANRTLFANKKPPTPTNLMSLLEEHLPLYMQMVDPTLDGPADPEALKIFDALNSLGVISVRPIMLAMSKKADAINGMRYILRLVVRRIVVGNLGTGNVERRFGEAAKKVNDTGNWHVAESELNDLNPSRQEFVDQIRKRSFNKAVLAFLRKSILSQSITPSNKGVLHLIRPRQTATWNSFSDEDFAFFGGTVSNTFLSSLDRRPKGADSWIGFKLCLLNHGIDGEWKEKLENLDEWSAASAEAIGEQLARAAGNVWY